MTPAREKIIVYFYAGYKEEETPRSLMVGDKVYAVEKVLSRKRCLEKDSERRYELFVCQVAGKTVKIRRDETGECEISPAGDFLAPAKK
jgi:hypothetical protein